MTTRTFAAWVELYAEHLRDNRRQVVAFAHAAPAGFWEAPSPLEGWTNKDLLAHIGGANDQLLQQLLRSVIAGAPVDTAVFATIDTDGSNRRGVEERRGWPAADVIAEVEVAGEELQDLLAQLTDAHEHLRQQQPPFILKGFLDAVRKESHDLEHLAQLRAALEASR